MSGFSDDVSSQLNMLMRAYLVLERIDPNRGLLRLVKPYEDRGGFDETQELHEIYGKPDQHPIYAWAYYTFALDAAIKITKEGITIDSLPEYEREPLQRFRDYQDRKLTKGLAEVCLKPCSKMDAWVLGD